MWEKEDPLIKNVWEPVFWLANSETGEMLLDVGTVISDLEHKLSEVNKASFPVPHSSSKKGSQAPD